MNNIKNAREEKGYTQEQLAKLLEIKLITMRFYEYGKCTPSVKNLCKMSEILDVTVGYLLGKE